MTTMPMKPTTTVRLSYLYREGDNHTRVGDVLLANPEGVELKEATRRLCAALEDEQYFIARQVRVPGLFHAAAGQPATDADHAWHTFADMGLCDEEPNDMHGRTLTQFLAEIEAAARAGWQANVLVGAPWEGEYVQVAGNAGVVLKVYGAAYGGWAAQIYFVKNAFQRQTPELHTSETLRGRIAPASHGVLAAEIGSRDADIQTRLVALLEYAGAAQLTAAE